MYYSGTAGVWFGQSKWMSFLIRYQNNWYYDWPSLYCSCHAWNSLLNYIFPSVCINTCDYNSQYIYSKNKHFLKALFVISILSFYIDYTLICLTYECVINIKKVEDVILSLHSLIFSDVNWFVIQPNFRDKSFNVYQTTCNYLNNIQ